MTHTRRSFLASMVALPFGLKAFLQPSQAAVAEFQTVYPPTFPISGTYRLISNGIPSNPIAYNATETEIQEGLDDLIRRGGSFTKPRANPCITIDTMRVSFDDFELQYTVEGCCSSCQHEYKVPGSRIPNTETVAWDCPHCDKAMTKDIMEFFK